uniref:Prolyl 4-hydroxylase alpha subunit Fe(2+) 2OG dioxygenase domain-containing protein n=1 Tax=Dunaliella tertiolecta TaxID=3047 RepID=A0A7S3R8W3_DUNTE
MDNRYATVLLYLSEVEEGGETTLPLATAIDEEAQQITNASQCASRMGIAIKPKKGNALLFFDMDIAGSKGDRRALHAACPALRGTKWTATKWIHNHPQGRFDPLQRAGACTDLDAHCAQEAANGGCSQDGMMGLAGRCRKTCGDCTVCQPNDIICYRSNLRSKADKVRGE